MTSPADRPVTLAAVAGAHGVRGEMRLKLFAESLDSLKAHKQLQAGDAGALTLLSVRDGAQGPIARFAEITDRSAAEALRGTLLTVARSQLPPLPAGEYYWHDLVGLPVVTPDGALVGEVTAVENYGASDILDIKRVEGGSVMVPLIPAAVSVGEQLVVAPEWLE